MLATSRSAESLGIRQMSVVVESGFRPADLGTVKLFEIANGKLLKKLSGHRGKVNMAAFTPDSKVVYVSNSGTKSVTAIDISTLKIVALIPVGEVPKRMNTLVLH